MSGDGLQFQGIIRVRSANYAVLDEIAYFEALYAGSSVPNRQLYEIDSPFRMDSETAALTKNDRAANDNTLKRKRRHGSSSNIPGDLRQLKKILEEAVKSGAFNGEEHCSAPGCSAESSPNFNNRQTRQFVTSLASVPCPLSCYEKKECAEKKTVKEVRLSQANRNIVDIPNELVLWTNVEPDVVTVSCGGEEYILPPFSSFIVNDASASKALIKRKKLFDFILLDPPWENRSVKRKRTYPISDEPTSMLDLCIPELLMETGLLAIWVTNNARYFRFIDEMIEYFGYDKIATWRWLKVTKSGEPVYSLDSYHKQPFESIVFASNDIVSKHYMKKIVDKFALISTPSAIHSRKPPLLPILQALGILEDSAVQLELYGRYLLPRTTTIGFEAPKLQNKRYFI